MKLSGLVENVEEMRK